MATSAPGQSSATGLKSQRVLACLQCQQRKVKCDRKFPCAHCVKAGTQCVPAALVQRQRRRRFPERELLERLRLYEDLLRQNHIDFEPLHPQATETTSPIASVRGDDSIGDTYSGGRSASAGVSLNGSTKIKSENVFEAKNLWNAINQTSPRSDDRSGDEDDDSDSSPDDVREDAVRAALDGVLNSNDHLLFGTRRSNLDLSTLHPQQIHIFKLWQVYLENVDPLLKITHTPTLQARIVDAAENVATINSTLEALLFSIYCISIQSLSDDDCRAWFASPKNDLLTTYQLGCQQALLNSEVLRTADRDCLTALVIYLMSVTPGTDPRSVSSMFGIAVRVAQRMQIHREAANAKCTAFEAEMRRRLWWTLVIFDNRLSEMAGLKDVILDPTWDCKTPLNLNDSDLRPEMKDLPAVHGRCTEAFFAVVRSEIADFVRHSASHLDFLNPALKAVAKEVQHHREDEGLMVLDKMIDEKYLQYSDPENPLHFMTLWTARAYLAKNCLLEHYLTVSSSGMPQTDADRDVAMSYAIRMLEADTKLMTSPLSQRYLWLILFQFQFPACVHTIQDLKRRPKGRHAKHAWEAMSDNYEARSIHVEGDDNPFVRILSRNVFLAWAACQSDEVPPRIVSDLQRKVTQMASNASSSPAQPLSGSVGTVESDDYSMQMFMDWGSGWGGQQTTDLFAPWTFPKVPAATAAELDPNRLDWSAMDWNLM